MRRLLNPKTFLPLLLVGFGLYLLVALAMVYGATRPERKPLEDAPGLHGLRYEDVVFTPRDGHTVLRGWLIEGTSNAPFLIFVHGIGDQRSGNRAVELAAKLVQAGGYNILLFDLRAQGESAGRFVTAGERERYDVLGAYDFVVSRGAEAGSVGLVGRSYGAATAIMAAALEPGIAGLVADSPFADVKDRISRETARKTPIPEKAVPAFLPPATLFARLMYGIDLAHLRPERDVAKLAFPVLVIHGESDTRIPFDEGRRVFEAAPTGSELWAVPGVGHAAAYLSYPEEYLERVLTYLRARF